MRLKAAVQPIKVLAKSTVKSYVEKNINVGINMNKSSYLYPECIIFDSRTLSLRHAYLRIIAALHEHHSSINMAETLHSLMEHEKQSQTAIGQGLAIPNMRVRGLVHSSLVLLRMEAPIAMNALDSHPVDVIAGLFSPHSDRIAHLQNLSRLHRHLTAPGVAKAIRDARDESEIHILFRLHDPEADILAA